MLVVAYRKMESRLQFDLIIVVKWERAEKRLEILADGLIHIGKEATKLKISF